MEDSFLEDDFLKPAKIIMEDECDDYFPTKKEENFFKDNFGINEIKTEEKEKKEVDLFTFPKLIYDDKVLDDSDEDKEEEENNYLFKPIDLVYEDHLELFNKRREQGIVIGSSKRCDKNEEKTGVGKPKTFLGCLRAEIRAKVFDKKD